MGQNVKFQYKTVGLDKPVIRHERFETVSNGGVADVLGEIWDNEDGPGELGASNARVTDILVTRDNGDKLVEWTEYGEFQIFWDNFDNSYEQYKSDITDMWDEMREAFE